MIVSFSKTLDPLLAGKKTCSRRRWKERHARHFGKGSRHQAWSNLPRVSGARHVGMIEMECDVYQERLGDMPVTDLIAEGGLWSTVDEFINFINGKPDEVIWVVRFVFQQGIV